MNIVITGVTGMRNRGVEAMVRPTLQHFRSGGPGTKITVLTRSPEIDSGRLGGGTLTPMQGQTEFTQDLYAREPDPASRGALRRLRTRASMALGRGDIGRARIRSLLASADAVVALGGDIFSSHYAFRPHIRPLEYAIDQGVPVIFLAHSIGPFVNKEEARLWTRVAQRAHLITTRERRSYRYVTETLGIRGPQVSHTADISFLLDPEPGGSAALSSLYGLDESAPRVALAPNAHMAAYVDIDPRQHRDAWKQLIANLIRNTDAEIVLIPHVQETWPNHDDRQFATELVRTLGYPERVRLIAGDHSAAEFKALISTCSLTVGERMHAVLAALSSGRCAVPVAYSVKAHGIVADLLGESTGSELVIAGRDCAPSSFVGSALDAWDRRSEIEEMLKNSLPPARERAKENFELLAEVTGQTAPSTAEGDGPPMTPSSASSRTFASRDDSTDSRQALPQAASR